MDGDFPPTAMVFCTSTLPQTCEIQSFSYIPDRVTVIQSLDEVEVPTDQKTLYLLDLDDTIYAHPFALGSRKWRANIKEQMLQLLTEDPEIQEHLPINLETKQIIQSLHDQISYSLALHAPVVSVEPLTQQWIESLQQKGHQVQGLTVRERNVWFYTAQEGVDILTRDQLSSIGIDFQTTEQISAAIEPYAFGIHFSPQDDKGDYFEKLLLPALQSQGMPDTIIFIDDKLSHVESMAKALSRNGIKHHSYHYTAIDAKEAGYDPLIANIQLFYYWMFGKERILSDADARAIARQHPDKEAASYLKPILLDILRS